MLLRLQEFEQDAVIGRLIVADAYGQIAWQELVGERFAQFDYAHGLALVWHVAGRASPVVIDPRVAFGAPTVGGLPTWILKGRWNAGESLDDINEDFDIDKELIVHGLQFEGIELAA